ncbi:MAG: glycine--tRNA ligase subunit beta [Deltaproteobacteria bacterium]|nr:glycine--tRNA ligase subunit beta [Deltaproteobacteria bacterium]
MKTLLFEIGTEELPAMFIPQALDNLKKFILKELSDAGLACGEARIFATPRRLSISLDIDEEGKTVTEDTVGPPIRVAFDSKDKPTKAAESFAQKVGKKISDLKKITTDKGEYLAARVEMPGKLARNILPQLLGRAFDLDFPKSMRWGNVTCSFGRPVRWICAIYGNDVVPVSYGDVVSSRHTRGHRFLAPGEIEIHSIEKYEGLLEKAHVIPDLQKRKIWLEKQVDSLAASVGAVKRPDEHLLAETTCLVESPFPVLGKFPESYLTLPTEVLIQEMRKHQRYFNLIDSKKNLLPYFIAVSNTPVSVPEISVRGYERVLRARLEDARFFFDADRKKSLESRLPKLKGVVFHKHLGNLFEKSERIKKLACVLAEVTKNSKLAGIVSRAAKLSKTDLVTLMVGEFPELQGVMGRYYAMNDGEEQSVAQAIEDHYYPRYADDQLPETTAGAIVGLADRLDTLVSFFAINELPTSTSDPFAIRRACLGILNICTGFKFYFSLSKMISEAEQQLDAIIAKQKNTVRGSSLQSQLMEFIRGRIKAFWINTHKADVVEAVLAAGFDDITETYQRIVALEKLACRDDIKSIGTVFKRVVNIVKKQDQELTKGKYDVSLFVENAEKKLAQTIDTVDSKIKSSLRSGNFEEAFEVIADLEAPLACFFDEVMVMVENIDLMRNRVKLLHAVTDLFKPLADISRLNSKSNTVEQSPL